MKMLNNAVKELVKFDFNQRDRYQKVWAGASFSFGDGVLWFFTVLVLIAAVIYNAWFLIWGFLLQNFSVTANPEVNKTMIILFLIGLGIAIIEKIFLFKTAKKNEEEANKILDEREKFLEACDVAAKKSGVELDPWWRKFNGLTYKKNTGADPCLVFLPARPLVQGEHDVHVAEIGEGISEIKGKDIVRLMEKKVFGEGLDYASFVSQEIEPESTYCIGDVYLIDFSSAEFQYTDEISDGKEEQRLENYRRELDEKERSRNYYLNGNYSTNEDMYFSKKKDVWDYATDVEIREEKMKRFQDNMHGKLVTRVANEGMWYFNMENQGYFILNEKGKIVAVILNEQKKSETWQLLTTDCMPGAECVVEKIYSEGLTTAKKETTLRYLPTYDLASIDFTIQKPQNISDKEWGLWIYSHYTKDTLFN